MIEEIKEQVYALHDYIMEKPNQILRIFQDFFGEDKVDMQGFPSKEEFYSILSTERMGDSVSFAMLQDSTEYAGMSEAEQTLVDNLWSTKYSNIGAITKDVTLAKYFLPLMREALSSRLFSKLFILVYFPVVKVTNEFNKSVNIRDLWVKVPFDYNGRGKGYFGMNRSYYTLDQFRSRYLHSHVASIPIHNFEKFQTPCTGTGPINDTLSTLAIRYDEAIWQLLCLEISRYVRVESISGVPHHRLENITILQGSSTTKRFSATGLRSRIRYNSVFSGSSILSDFIKYLLSTKKLKFSYSNGSYKLGMPYTNTVILISNEFINWYNIRYKEGFFQETLETLYNKNIVAECMVLNNKIYTNLPRVNSGFPELQYSGSKICKFKGENITLVISDRDPLLEGASNNRVIILNLRYIDIIVCNILRILNYGYGREENNKSGVGISSTTRYI